MDQLELTCQSPLGIKGLILWLTTTSLNFGVFTNCNVVDFKTCQSLAGYNVLVFYCLSSCSQDKMTPPILVSVPVVVHVFLFFDVERMFLLCLGCVAR